MSTATYKRRHFNWCLLTAPEGESITIMEGSKAAGRHGVGAGAESACLDLFPSKNQRELTENGVEANWEWSRLLKPSSPSPVTHLLQQSHSS